MDRCPHCGSRALVATQFDSTTMCFPLPAVECGDCERLFLDEETIESRVRALLESAVAPASPAREGTGGGG